MIKRMRERDQVRTIAQRWRKSWGDGSWPLDRRGRMVGAELAELDPETATADQIAEITDRPEWCAPLQCAECGKRTWDIVQLGEDEYIDSRTTEICIDCLRTALALMEAKA